MASLRTRLDGLLTDVGLTPGLNFLDDARALASALGFKNNACVAEIVGASELALYGAQGMPGCRGGAPSSSSGGVDSCLPSAPKKTSDAPPASLLKKRKTSERDIEAADADEMQVSSLMDFVAGVLEAPESGGKPGESLAKKALHRKEADRAGRPNTRFVLLEQSANKKRKTAEEAPTQNAGGTAPATRSEQGPAPRSSDAVDGAHTMLGAQRDASQSDLKGTFLRAVTVHAKRQGDSGPIDMQRFQRFEKAYERCLDQHFQGKCGILPPKETRWITFPALLLQLLRESSLEKWAETLSVASEQCLLDSMDMVTTGKDTLPGILSNTMDERSSQGRALEGQRFHRCHSDSKYRSWLEFRDLTVSTLGNTCMQTALHQHADLVAILSEARAVHAGSGNVDAATFLLQKAQNKLALRFHSFAILSSKTSGKRINTPAMVSMMNVKALASQLQSTLCNQDCNWQERRRQAYEIVNEAKTKIWERHQIPLDEWCKNVKEAVQEEQKRRMASQADGEHADQNQGEKSEKTPRAAWWRRKHTTAKLSCGLKPQDFPAFKQDLDKWTLHMQSSRHMSKRLADRAVVLVLRAASWLVEQEKVELSVLCTADIISSQNPEGAEFAKEYIAWLEKEKGVSKSHAQQNFHAFILLAEFVCVEHHGNAEGKVLQTLRKASATAKFHVTQRRFSASENVYRLKRKDIPESLSKELKDFQSYMSEVSFQHSDPILRPSTCKKHMENIHAALGWAKHAIGREFVPQLQVLVPSQDANGAEAAFRFLHWLRTERKCSPKSELVFLGTFKRLAKFLFRHPSATNFGNGLLLAPRKQLNGLEVIQQFLVMEQDAVRRAKSANPCSDIRKKWISWPEFLQAVEKLRSECATMTSRRKVRKRLAVARSWQRYLICKIMAATADRQRTYRELEIGRTLVKVPHSEMPCFSHGRDEIWAIKHSAADYKTGRVYGDRPLMPLAPDLSRDINTFIAVWRPLLHANQLPPHQFLFCRKNGKPLHERCLWAMLSQTMRRLVGRAVNPHLLRDMIVTHARSQDSTSYKDLEALALYMGHSIREQQATYDKRSKSQKVLPAVSLMQSFEQDALNNTAAQNVV